jgi:hypothetical protein
MALKKRERKPDNIQNSKQMTLSTKFNFKFATLQKYSSKKTTLNIASIQEDQRRKKIKGNTELYNFTSINILKIAKKKNYKYQENIISSLKTHPHHKCQNVFIKK